MEAERNFLLLNPKFMKSTNTSPVGSSVMKPKPNTSVAFPHVWKVMVSPISDPVRVLAPRTNKLALKERGRWIRGAAMGQIDNGGVPPPWVSSCHGVPPRLSCPGSSLGSREEVRPTDFPFSNHDVAN